MKKVHVLAVALLLGLSAALGLVAATRTAGMRSSTHGGTASAATIGARTQQLDRVERQLRSALRDKPPALLALPAANRVHAGALTRVVYRRPAPLVVIRHSPHHGDDGAAESEGNDD